jgi:thymidylate kinase
MAKKSVIVIDRYYYDFEFDHGQKNVKLPGWLIRSMQRLLPSPEIVIHVDTDTASVLSRRSDEVDEQEIDRQRTALKSITKRLRSAGTVDGSQSSESATNQALEVIVRVLSKDRLS